MGPRRLCIPLGPLTVPQWRLGLAFGRPIRRPNKMEGLLTPKEQAEGRVEGEEEDHVFLDLDDVYEYTDIPANVPYVLSGFLSFLDDPKTCGGQP
ncbi:hypothetical protein Taro_045666 [Colocasia esculenta]|uniref:Uncharacterized protein n=1 Tax=Colocasia esculenta TaxID=4460 RepID=A0A843WRV8_COLES|nr:hypothetical protein [Colocasia esculenta]